MTYYTYAHSSPEGKIFYIGKGVDDRAYSFSERSHDWKRAVKYHKGLQIEILANWDTEEEAFDHEKLLISCFKDMNCSLVNLTSGGKGPYGFKQSEELKKKKSLKLTGHKYELLTCPKCEKTGGKGNMKRWHFDNCKGAERHKARVSVNCERLYLGTYPSKEEAQSVIDKYLKDTKNG